jgi:hypothetical protein
MVILVLFAISVLYRSISFCLELIVLELLVLLMASAAAFISYSGLKFAAALLLYQM